MRRIPINVSSSIIVICAAIATVLVFLYFVLWRKVTPVKGTVTSRFGNRTAPTSGASTNHNGTDIAVPVGTKIKSPWAGKVTSVMTNNAGGLQMVVTHYNGYKTGYAHLSEVIRQKGQLVLPGQAIALSGNTGNTTGPHLHFTITNPAGEKIDPENKFDFEK